jgi:dolichyl-phosphate-mannose--protein O-mannosyl transferase
MVGSLAGCFGLPVILLVFQISARFLANFKAGIAVFYACINIDFLLGQVTDMTHLHLLLVLSPNFVLILFPDLEFFLCLFYPAELFSELAVLVFVSP